MSSEPRHYDPRYIHAWTVLSIILGLVLLSMFIFGDAYLYAGHVVWSLLRWLCRGII